ncbi:MAG TPA: glutaredoxin family protein, partial [Gammaproteobacteria bacterium]|nr:glutaredoxin family protein [Gammaproteobacteria bacterium]
MPDLTLYYRQHCPLCEQMLAEIHALYGGELEVRLVDVDSDAALAARYGLKVPVLSGGERELC